MQWILTAKPEQVTQVWKQVVAGVINNQLGSSCKVSANKENDEYISKFPNTRLRIAIYPC